MSLRPSESSIAAIEGARCAHMVAADVAALEPLLSDRLRWVHSSGLIETKAAFLDRLAGPDRYLSISRVDVAITVLGDAALSIGRAEMTARVGGEDRRMSNLYTNLWVVEDGHLRLLACQSTKAAP